MAQGSTVLLIGTTPDTEGDHLQLKPPEDYIALGYAVNFYTVVESAKKHGHLVLGYCLEAEAEDAKRNFGVRLNPPKSARITFSQGDRLIIVAKEELQSAILG